MYMSNGLKKKPCTEQPNIHNLEGVTGPSALAGCKLGWGGTLFFFWPFCQVKKEVGD